MAEDDSRWNRLQAGGLAGLVRRARYRLRGPWRGRKAARWQARWVGEEAAAPTEVPERHRSGSVFFFGSVDPSARESFGQRFAADREELVSQAEATLAGDLSWVVRGGTPDWNLALPGRARWPSVASEAVRIGAAEPLGDVRLAWEVGRCAHVVRVAQAAWLTREDRFAKSAVGLLRDFERSNPPGCGIGWLHAQEVGLRAIAWLWVESLLSGHSEWDGGVAALWTRQVMMHGEFVEATLSDGPVTHNHLVSEAAALFMIGTAVPELPRAPAWRRIGLGLLWREVIKQTYAEGLSGEGSTHYHAFVLDSCVAALLLADRARVPVPAPVRDRIAAMANGVAVLVRSDGTLPAIGDTDAGRAWRLGVNPADRRDVLAAAAVSFDRPDWGAIAGDSSGAFWLTGGAPVPGAGASPPPGLAHCFRSSGLGVARSAYASDEDVLLFRAGPTELRPDVAVGHQHADALSVTLRTGGHDVLVESGTYLYSEGAGWRGWLRGTRAHSTVVVDGRDQADVTTARFGILGLKPARWTQFEGDGSWLLAAAEHSPGPGILVRRRVFWTAEGLLLLCDDVEGEGEHEVEVLFQIPQRVDESAQSGSTLRVQGEPSAEFLTLSGGEPPRVAPSRSGRPGPGAWAPHYGTLAVGSTVSVRAGLVGLPHRLLTAVRVGDSPPHPKIEHRDGGVQVRMSDGAVMFPNVGESRWTPGA